MTEKRFTIIDGIKKGTHSGIWDNQKQNNQRIGDELWVGEVVAMLNEGVMIVEENEQLKSDNNRLVNETAKVVAEHQRKVFELIDEKINLLENDYKKAVKNGMPSNSVYGEIELLEELKKELQEYD